MTAVLAIARRNGLVLALLGAVTLAFLFPQLGAQDGALHAGTLSATGVMVVFFLQGLALRTGELVSGLRNLRVHALTQAWIFVLAPVILTGAAGVCDLLGHRALAAGFLYLALLPTTITSAILFTGAAGGNVPAAIFNTTVSNVFGVFWVPLGCLALFTSSGGFPVELVLPLLAKVAKLILLPLLAGQLLRPLVREAAAFRRVAPTFKYVNHGIIVFIVFATFCDSVLADAWQGIGIGTLALLVGLTSGALLLVHAGVWFSGGWLLQRQADRVAALFCGAQKTLAAGVPMAAAIFPSIGDRAIDTGLLLLPLLCYHPLQLLLAAALLQRLKDPG